MFKTMVVGWVTIISVSHIPFHPFDTQTVASPLSLTCALQSFFLIALHTFLHRDRGLLVCACIVWESHESWTYRCIFLSSFFPTITLLHSIVSQWLFFIFSSLFQLLLVLFHIFSTLSGDPPQFITWRIVTSFPLSILWTLVQRFLV